jgi:hypothetical protein
MIKDFVIKARSKQSRLFQGCIESLDPALFTIDPKTGDAIVKLRWELLVMFGSRKQLKDIDAFRVSYIDGLIQKHCTPLIDCHTEIIGSRSPKSNIDINMTCPQHMEQVIHNIFAEHAQAYPNASLEDVFDTNIYASVFRYIDERCPESQVSPTSCYPRYKLGYRQRMWSFLRVVEMCEAHLTQDERQILLDSWPHTYVKMYQDTRSTLFLPLRRKMSHTTNETGQMVSYARAITRYLRELSKPTPDPEVIAERFSVSKTLEHDTYRSVGAVLHIVEHRKNMSVSSFFDSCYDNIGFVFQALLKPSICVTNTSTLLRVIKIAKYVERVMDALKIILNHRNIKSLPTRLKKLEKLCIGINSKRKAVAPVTEIADDVEKVLKIINLPQSASPFEILVALSSLVFGELPADWTAIRS